MPGDRLTSPLAASVKTKHRRIWNETCLEPSASLVAQRHAPLRAASRCSVFKVQSPCHWGSGRFVFSVLALSYHRDIALTSPLPINSQTRFRTPSGRVGVSPTAPGAGSLLQLSGGAGGSVRSTSTPCAALPAQCPTALAAKGVLIPRTARYQDVRRSPGHRVRQC